jgi:tetratricopeptide (TPR) repeat protein
MIKIRTLILDHSDRILRRFDRKLRASLSKAFPAWPQSMHIPIPASEDSDTLIALYRSVDLAERGNRSEAIDLLRRAFAKSLSPHVKARVVQFLALNLCFESVDERNDGNLEASATLEAQCREACDLALQQYDHYAWSWDVRYSLHAALGILDYYQTEKLTAKLHLGRALEEHRRASSVTERRNWQLIGLVHLYMGDLLKDDRNWKEAVAHYRTAARLLAGAYKIEALVRLATTSIDAGGSLRWSRRVAEGALRLSGSVAVRSDVVDELKCTVAWLCCELGERDKAERLYRDVVATSANAKTREKVLAFLGRKPRTEG